MALLWKMTCNWRQPTGVRHAVHYTWRDWFIFWFIYWFISMCDMCHSCVALVFCIFFIFFFAYFAKTVLHPEIHTRTTWLICLCAITHSCKNIQSGEDILIGHFPQKRPIISGSSEERDLQHLPVWDHPIMREHTGWQRHLYRSFSAKEPFHWWLFCGKRPATFACVRSHIYARTYGVAKMHGMPYFDRPFSVKEPYS